jgi:hypothetical protein
MLVEIAILARERALIWREQALPGREHVLPGRAHGMTRDSRAMKHPTFRSCFCLLACSSAGQAIFRAKIRKDGCAGRWGRRRGRAALFAQSESLLPLVSMTPEEFIDKWSRADRTERQAAQEHFIDLCRMLGEPTPTAIRSRRAS